MDTITKPIYKQLIHEHPLFPSARFYTGKCNACHVTETMYGGYFCNEPNCNVWFFHKECTEAPSEIKHPSHPQHTLMLRNSRGDNWTGTCDLCGRQLLFPCYTCFTCNFDVDLLCGMKPSPPIIQHPLCHDHPLTFLKKPDMYKALMCDVCKVSILRPVYSCLKCNVYFHVDCVYLSKEVNHPFHTNHPLKLIVFEGLTKADAEKICLSCGQPPVNVIYHCSICNFTICLICTRNPPPLVIEHTKTHIHSLSLFPRKMPFTCDVCGEEGNEGPYVCLQCGFLIHGNCIDLPRVININRHDHRVSFTHHLGVGYSKCGVCRKILSQYHGAYSCTVCENYAAHSRCAVRDDVWDKTELEGIPDETEDIAPFKVVGDDLINHFSHDKHPLRLYKSYILYSEWIQCDACMHPVGFDPIYGCEECGFVLHEKCANLTKKKRVVFDMAPYTLKVGTGVVNCKHCRTLSDGFKYSLEDKLAADLHCGSLSEPFFHDGHLHPLYFCLNDGHYCDGCYYNIDGYVFRCDACAFILCFYCANLPLKICHWNDEHPLTLFCGEKVNQNIWCDICERKLDICKWFYTCLVCGVTLHARCVLGDFSRLRLGGIFVFLKRFLK